MSNNIDEFLTFRTKTRKQIEIRERQWKVDEQGFSQKDKQLQEKIWELERIQRENQRNKSAAEESKRLDINNYNVDIKSRLDQFKRQITLSSLKHLYSTDKIEYQRERGYHYAPDDFKEEVVYDTPLVKIFALFGKNDKPTNQVEYTLKCFTHLPLKRTINPLMIREKNHGKYYFRPEDDVLIAQKSFKTLEEAEQYHTRNKTKLIKDYIPQIDALMSEIQNAEDDFNKVFDFRLIENPEFITSARERNYTVTKLEKNYMELSWRKTDWEGNQRVESSGTTSIKQDGLSFEIDGDLEDRVELLTNLDRFYDLPSIRYAVKGANDAYRAYISEEKRLKVLAMSDEELIKHYYIRSPDEAQEFKTRMSDGKHTINYYDWSVAIKEAV